MKLTTTQRNLIKSFFFLSLLLFAACKPDNNDNFPDNLTKNHDRTIALEWQKLICDIGRYAPGFRPPVQARALGYIGLAGYEAAVPGMPQHNSLAQYYRGLKLPQAYGVGNYNWAICVHAAYSTIIKSFYPNIPDNLKGKISDLENRFYNEYKAKTPAKVFERSKKFGIDIANAVYNWSATDTEGHLAWQRNHPTDYVPPTGIGLWQPSYPDFTRALLPKWGKVRQFAITESDKTVPPPIPYSNKTFSAYYKQAKEVYDETTTKFNYEKKWVAEFWSDDNFELTLDPATRFISVTNQVLDAKKVDLATAVYAYAKVGLALADAGIACWNSKYVYNVERPVHFIRREMNADWVSKLNNPLKSIFGYTPPFPAYPSGHSTFGVSACKALASVTGDYVSMYDKTHEGRTEFLSKPRYFKTLTEMGVENAMSRIPLGVHFRMDCESGIELGQLVGKRVNSLKWEKPRSF